MGAVAFAALSIAQKNLSISPNHIFADAAARDTYFTGHASELVDNIYISVGAGFQQRVSGAWVDKTAVVQGPKGDTGATGATGATGPAGPDAASGISFAPYGPVTATDLQTVLQQVIDLIQDVYVRITVTGATFAPIIGLASGSAATVSWEVEGGATYTGLTPNINFGAAATRYVRMRAKNNGLNALGDVTTFNIGFDHTADAGQYNVGSAYNHAAQTVTRLENVNTMTGLVRFLANTSSLACDLNFTGMSELEFIECYGSSVTGVTLTGCTSLIRLCMEGDDLATLDLNPVAANLRDLRASGNRSPLTFTPLTAPLAQLYHYCAQSETVVNHPTAAQLPVIEEQWDWNSGQTGALVCASSSLTSLISNNNNWTSVDLTNQFPVGHDGTVTLNNCQLNSVTLTGCNGLTNMNFSNNLLGTAAVDSILSTVNAWNTSGGTLNLAGNAGPSSTTNVNALTARGWTVTTDDVAGTPTVIWEDSFDRADATGVANVGNGWEQLNGTALDCNIVSGDLLLTGAGGYGVLGNPAGGSLPADYTVSMTLPVGSKGTWFGLFGRGLKTSPITGVRLLFGANEETFTVGQVDGWDSQNITMSTPNFPASWANTTITHTVALRFSGTTVSVICDGQVVSTGTCTNNSASTGTYVGFCGEHQTDRYRPLIQVTSNT